MGKNTTVNIDKEQLAQLQQLRQETGVSVAEIVRRALREYLERHARIDALIREYSQAKESDD